MTNEELAQSIKLIRESNFMTQAEFAKEIGVNKQAIWYWEKGIKRPSMPHLKKIEEFRKKALAAKIEYEQKQSELLKLKAKVKRQEKKAL